MPLSLSLARPWKNVATVVKTAGGDVTDVMSLRLYVTDKQRYLQHTRSLAGFHRRVFGKHFPAMALIVVAGLLRMRRWLKSKRWPPFLSAGADWVGLDFRHFGAGRLGCLGRCHLGGLGGGSSRAVTCASFTQELGIVPAIARDQEVVLGAGVGRGFGRTATSAACCRGFYVQQIICHERRSCRPGRRRIRRTSFAGNGPGVCHLVDDVVDGALFGCHGRMSLVCAGWHTLVCTWHRGRLAGIPAFGMMNEPEVRSLRSRDLWSRLVTVGLWLKLLWALAWLSWVGWDAAGSAWRASSDGVRVGDGAACCAWLRSE